MKAIVNLFPVIVRRHNSKQKRMVFVISTERRGTKPEMEKSIKVNNRNFANALHDKPKPSYIVIALLLLLTIPTHSQDDVMRVYSRSLKYTFQRGW